MNKFFPVYILAIFGFQFASGQLSEEQIQQGYEYYNSRKNLIDPEKILSSVTLNPNQIENACDYINTDSIFKNFDAQKSIINNKLLYLQKELDTAFTDSQLKSLNRKFQKLDSISIQKARLKSSYKLLDSSYFKQSFPIIQQSKDSSIYAFIYEESKFYDRFGRMSIEKKVDDDWKNIGGVFIPLYNLDKFRNDLIKLPEEYQVINSYLAGEKDFIAEKFIEIKSKWITSDRYKDFEAWKNMGRTIFQDRIDITKHFEKSNLVDIVNYFRSGNTGFIDESMLFTNLKCSTIESFSDYNSGSNIYSFSKPFIFTSNLTCDTYAVFYVSRFGGPLNGSGSIIVMQKKNGIFKTLISHMLWIS